MARYAGALWPLVNGVSTVSLLDEVSIPSNQRGRPRKRCKWLLADKGYDAEALRRYGLAGLFHAVFATSLFVQNLASWFLWEPALPAKGCNAALSFLLSNNHKNHNFAFLRALPECDLHPPTATRVGQLSRAQT